MTEQCHCPSEVASSVCSLSGSANHRPSVPTGCPQCKEAGKPVEGQTVKAVLSVSLRAVQETEYRFCPVATCPVVYFAADGSHYFTTSQVREQVYQKAPDEDNVLICYCFQHTAGTVRAASSEWRAVIVADITAGIQQGQCACDLRNPQGSCCLGNVRNLIKRSRDTKQEATEEVETAT
jgi:hypothetical protein